MNNNKRFLLHFVQSVYEMTKPLWLTSHVADANLPLKVFPRDKMLYH